jgi:hypothetical protein
VAAKDLVNWLDGSLPRIFDIDAVAELVATAMLAQHDHDEKARIERQIACLNVLLPDDAWLIAEAIEYFGATKVPTGSADGVDERVRDLDTVKRADPDDDYSPIVGHTDALRTEGRLYPRATNWRALARELPPGADRDAALKRERTIAGLLGDTFWPRLPGPAKPERRFATPYFNRGLDVFPRGKRDVADPIFCGPFVERDGKLVPLRQKHKHVIGDAVDRIDKTASTDFAPE